MADNFNPDTLTARDDANRSQMAKASDRLLVAIFRELNGRASRNG